MAQPPPSGFHGRRVLRLAGADNVRDLGHLPTSDGRRTRPGRIFRGELVPSLLDADVRMLVSEVGLQSVVDLRTRGEIRHQPVPWLEHGVAWINAPFRLGDTAPVPDPDADYVDAYLGFLEGGPERIAFAARTLMNVDLHPVLFHCAAGKDRTGVLTALLLEVLGVPRETIAEDYELTSLRLVRVFERLAGIEPYRRSLAGQVAADHAPRAETMTAFLEEVERRYGGAEAWLVAQGLEPSTIERFRAAMLVPADDGAPGFR